MGILGEQRGQEGGGQHGLCGGRSLPRIFNTKQGNDIVTMRERGSLCRKLLVGDYIMKGIFKYN